MGLEALEEDRDEPAEWEPPLDIETAWAAWCLLRGTGWNIPLVEGGLFDQPDGLMADVAIIEWLSGLLEPEIRRTYRPGRRIGGSL